VQARGGSVTLPVIWDCKGWFRAAPVRVAIRGGPERLQGTAKRTQAPVGLRVNGLFCQKRPTPGGLSGGGSLCLMHQARPTHLRGGPEFLRRRRLSLLDAVLGVLVFAFVVFVVEHVNQVGDGDRHPLFLGDDQGLLPVLVLAVGGVLVD